MVSPVGAARRDLDVLVIGSGLAGLTVALSAPGRRVTVLTAWMPPGGTASAMAQGGIAAAVGADDSPEIHAADTQRAGVGLGDPEVIRLLCGEAQAAIAWLESQGVVFDREGDHRALHREAAHSRARVLHVNHDRTGFALTRTLTRALRARPDIEILSGYQAISLLRSSSPGEGIAGAVALDREGQAWSLQAADTVLATGGLGSLYAHTTNPRNACGEGLALALAAGARCQSLEFVQFHPTALAVAADPLPLLTEALRGAGARLIDDAGVAFMKSEHPSAELAPRDVVARAVWRRVAAGGHVYLDAREIFARQPAAFPSVRALCAGHRLDPAQVPVPVMPAAHYHMGGVAVDVQGRTSLAHLWACGEVSCTGVHGANRLASNSLLEATVFGRRVGQALAAGATPAPAAAVPVTACDRATLSVDAGLWQQLRELMWSQAGIVRDAEGLQTGLTRLAALEAVIPEGQVLLQARVRVARAILQAALARPDSIGAHYRADSTLTLPQAGSVPRTQAAG